jgi:(p)ppGpp synthase/HD superfamily hydrolase
MSNLTRSGILTARKHHVPNALSLYEKMFLPPQHRHSLKFLLHARSKRFFFKIVEIRHAPNSPGYELIEKAYRLLHHECRGRRRQSGEREAEHPTRMALVAMILDGVSDANKIAAVLLHDIIETFRDKWSVERLSREFNQIVGQWVGYLTKPIQRGRLIRDAALERAYRLQLRRGGKDVIQLKSYDVFDNLITLWGRSHRRMEKKVVDIEANLLPLMREFEIVFVRYIESVLENILHSIDRPRSLNTTP